MCTTAAEISRAKKQDKICILMGIEGGYAIEEFALCPEKLLSARYALHDADAQCYARLGRRPS